MTALGWLWLGSPFVLIAVISHDANMRELISAYPERCRAIGWAGVLAMFLGAALIPDQIGSVLFGIGTPLAGLVVWTRDRRDDGGEGDDWPDDVPPDWDEFERSFWDYARRPARPPSRPRASAPR